MRHISKILSVGVLALTCAAGWAASPATSRAPASGPFVKPFGLYLDYIDPSVLPGQDFFAYSNNGWIKKTAIASDRSSAGVMLEMDMLNEQQLKDLVGGLSGAKHLTAEGRKLRDLYADFTDVSEIEAAGMKPIAHDIQRIAGAESQTDILKLVSDRAFTFSVPVALSIDIDDKHPESYVVKFSQSGLGLPGRDYYLSSDAEMVKIQKAYKTYMATMLGFAGVDAKTAASDADAIYAFEKKIAEASLPSDARRDPNKMYNPMTVADLQAYAPGIDWAAYMKASGIPLLKNGTSRTVIVAEKSALPKLAKIFAETPLPVLKAYLTVQLVSGFAVELPARVDQVDFDFYERDINGQPKMQSREIRGIHFLDENMGMALGKLYVAKYFPPAAKKEARTLVLNLIRAYGGDIKTLSWMSPETRAKALEKLSQLTPKIGYPDKWRSYSALKIKRHDLVGNLKRVRLFAWNRALKRLDQPVDRGEWGMTPQTNNAYYNPSLNEVVFPAAIMQPPYFDMAADPAVNYGEIGAAIGHEISHGFDDQGSKYDGHGVLRNWWTDTDMKAFETRISALGKQYDAEKPLPGLHINGKLTMGENIADLAGLEIAYKAYHIALGGKPAPVLNGLTGDQRFFIAYAQSWRVIRREGVLRKLLLDNPHSPEKYRVNVVVQNVDAWYKAFNVQPGQKYYIAPEKRVHLW